MKSKVEIRKFAVEKAVELLGSGSPCKDVISKAQEIENYIVGSAEIPETFSEEDKLSELISKGILAIRNEVV